MQQVQFIILTLRHTIQQKRNWSLNYSTYEIRGTRVLSLLLTLDYLTWVRIYGRNNITSSIGTLVEQSLYGCLEEHNLRKEESSSPSSSSATEDNQPKSLSTKESSSISTEDQDEDSECEQSFSSISLLIVIAGAMERLLTWCQFGRHYVSFNTPIQIWPQWQKDAF